MRECALGHVTKNVSVCREMNDNHWREEENKNHSAHSLYSFSVLCVCFLFYHFECHIAHFSHLLLACSYFPEIQLFDIHKFSAPNVFNETNEILFSIKHVLKWSVICDALNVRWTYAFRYEYDNWSALTHSVAVMHVCKHRWLVVEEIKIEMQRDTEIQRERETVYSCYQLSKSDTCISVWSSVSSIEFPFASAFWPFLQLPNGTHWPNRIEVNNTVQYLR